MNAIKQLFGQTMIYGMGIVLPRLLNYLLLTPFYTRVFLPEEYGIITELYAYVVFLLVILTYGLETGFFRFASKNNNNLGSIYKTVLTSILFTTVVFLFFENVFNQQIANTLGYHAHAQFIRWLAIIVSIDAFTAIPFALIRVQAKPGKYTAIRIVEVTVNIGLNLYFLLYCPNNENKALVQLIYNPDLGVGYVLVSNLTSSLTKLLLLHKEIFIYYRSKVDTKLLKKILRYSFPLLVAGLAGTINEALDRILLKHLIDESNAPMFQLGIYGANYKIAVLMTLYVQMFKYAAEPFLFSKAKDRDAKMLYADVMKFFIIPGLLIFLMVTMYIDYFSLFIGKDFREGIQIVPVVLFANLMMGVFFNLSIWYKLTDSTIYGAMLVAIGAVITIIINVVFIPKYGYVASAWAHLVSYSIMVIMSYSLSIKKYRIKYNVKKIGLYVLIVLVIYLIDKLYIRTELNNSFLLKSVILICVVLMFFILERKEFLKYSFKQEEE